MQVYLSSTFFLIKLIQILAAVKINDDNDLNDIFNEIDDDSFNLTATLKATPKSAKKKKKMKLSAVSSLTVSRAELDTSSKFDSTKKRVLTERVTQPSKKPKLEPDVKYESVKKRIESKGFFFWKFILKSYHYNDKIYDLYRRVTQI